MIDLTYFIVILMVFVVSYAIAAYAVLYPRSLFNLDLFIKVMRLGYWNIYGELFLEELESKFRGFVSQIHVVSSDFVIIELRYRTCIDIIINNNNKINLEILLNYWKHAMFL